MLETCFSVVMAQHESALLAPGQPRCCHSSASAAPADSHLKPLPHFTGFAWELHRQPCWLSVQKNNLGHFWRHFVGTAKTFWTTFEEKVSFERNLAKSGQFCMFWGCGLPSSAAFCSNSAEASATRPSLSSIVWLQKNQNMWILAENPM